MQRCITLSQNNNKKNNAYYVTLCNVTLQNNAYYATLLYKIMLTM